MPLTPELVPQCAEGNGHLIRLVSVAKCVDLGKHGSVMPMNWA